MRKQDRKLDLAARAAWLYYIAGKRQDEIAEQLNVSRQAVQRLVALAVSEKLIKFRLDHPIATCMALSEELKACYGLAYCSVQPSDSSSEQASAGIAIAAADHMATYLAEREPLIIAFSTGRMLRSMADETPVMDCPQHRLVSLVGTISRDGRASPYEVVRRFAERTGAQCFPIPTPVVASSVEERQLLQSQRSFAVVRELASRAEAAFVGRVVDSSVNDRNAALPLTELRHTRMIGVSGSPDRVIAISAALRGGLLGGLITDERTALALLRARTSLDSAA